MDDSDDDVVLLEEVSPKISKTWKWKAPNPALKAGDTQKILQQVREKLNMKNSEVDSPDRKDEPAVLCAVNESPDGNTRAEQNNRTWVQTSLQFEKTPQKSVPLEAPISLTPEEISELTENCLDSDNEPCSGESFQTPPRSNQLTSGLKKRLFDKPNFTVSNSVRFRASQYFGAGTSSEDVNEILSEGDGDRLQFRNISPSKSPSPKKRRLSKHSPIRLLPSHRNLGKSPIKRSPGKINFASISPQGSSPTKMTPKLQSPRGSSDSRVLSDATHDSPNKQKTEMIAEGPYYYEAFCFMIKKIHDNKEYKHLFLESELKKMSQVNIAKLEFQLYVRLLNRKDKWNRCSDIAYADIASNLSPLFDYLEQHELISCDLHDEKLDVLLHLLKKDELKKICKDFKVLKTGTKPDLVNAFLAMQRSQRTLNGLSPLYTRVTALLGRCVRLAVNWRHVFRRCILLFSMFHSFEDLDRLGSEQALLLLQVKLKNVTFPLQHANITTGTMIFSNRDQLIRFEEASELRQEFNNALQIKNFKAVLELSDKGLRQFSTLLELTSETNHVQQLPLFLQKYSAGSVYAKILSASTEALRTAQEYEFALKVLDLLMSQNIYCARLKGEWALKKATLCHINLKDIVKACNILCTALKDKSLSFVDRMHLQQRAEKVFKLKKNGLSQEYKAILQKVMDPPSKAPEIVEISARAMPGFKPGLKKVYIRYTGDGKEYMSVEETVIAHYKSLGFVSGIHDEGSTISSLCLLSLWNLIYDSSVPSVFQSPYQTRPLDWACKDFYEMRKDAINTHFSFILSKDVQFVANQLCELREQHCHLTSLINWDRLEHLDIHAFLECMTLSVFVAISRRLVEDWKSHRKGFPDLVLWSPLHKKCLFIEVKSPNDKLSTVQSMWLDFLTKYNAKAFVVHIRESGSKVTVSKT